MVAVMEVEVVPAVEALEVEALEVEVLVVLGAMVVEVLVAMEEEVVVEASIRYLYNK
jgi:hypothetical protein